MKRKEKEKRGRFGFWQNHPPPYFFSFIDTYNAQKIASASTEQPGYFCQSFRQTCWQA
ncbi:MAG: hypothetical protein IPP67_06340 [Rhodospirillaceae bacterium]|nr:hypothetical protein [Rhodospirillaceae bacterium]